MTGRRVTRVIVLEGPADWVEQVLERSLVPKDGDDKTPGGVRATCILREDVEYEIEEDRESTTVDCMTEQEFMETVGRLPVNDDLDRVNCPQAGTVGHAFCGRCPHGLPRFEVCYQCHPEWKQEDKEPTT
jgi:hypothetical protein